MTEKRQNELVQLGRNVAYYRKLHNISQEEFASLLGISRTHLSNLEATKMTTSISLNRLLDIADALEIPAAKLFEFRIE